MTGVDSQGRDELRARSGFPERPAIDAHGLRRREAGRQARHAEPGLVPGRQAGDPRAESLENRLLAGPAPQERRGPCRPGDRRERVLLGRREERRDDALGLGDRSELLEVHAELSSPAHGDDPELGRVRDVEAERCDDARSAIELGLAHGGGSEPQRAGRLVEQSPEDLAESSPAPGEPSTVTRPDEPRGPRPFVVGEHRQFRAGLDRIDISVGGKSGVEVDDPGPDLVRLDLRDRRAGLPFQERGSGPFVRFRGVLTF
jgi:hypothetical protein